VSEADILMALATQYEVPFYPSISESWLDPALVDQLPVEWVRSHSILPVRAPDGLRALMVDPTRVELLSDLSLLLPEEPGVAIAPPREIARAIEQCYVQRTDSAGDFLDTLPAGGPEQGLTVESDDLLRMADQAPVTQLVNLILLDAVKGRASDIHVEPFENQLLVRYRIDGLLYDQKAPPKHLQTALISRLKVMGRLDIAEKRLPQDGTARVRVGEREIDIRVSTIPVAEGERVVLRLLNRETALYALVDLGMPPHVLTPFRRMLEQPNGVILVTGPTGSGKTTTLYAALNEVDTQRLNVLTIEDPIEYQLPRIGQIQVKPKIGLTFAHGLRHILRQDPDVILVGEIRDLETAEIAIRSSLTGHLVFSTLHTNDAIGAVLRMVDMGIPPYLLAGALRGALAQRLVRRLCPACRREGVLAPEEAAGWPERDGIAGRPVWFADGCSQCLAGYRGRIGLFELMVATADLREGIRLGREPAALAQLAREAGMAPLLRDGLEKLFAGETSLEELRRAVGHVG
jgi:general secretion pathway protein E